MKKILSLLALVTTLGVSGISNSYADDMVVAADEMVTAVETVAEPVVEVVEAAPVVVAEAEMAVVEAAAPEAPAEIIVDKGDTAWMMVATLLVVMMTVPGLALFYGGLVRSKNMLSVLMQVLVVFSLISVLWAVYGYSLAFGSGSGLIIGDLGKLFLQGVTMDSLADTFTDNVKIPEMIFIAFQCTFAGITCALIVGSFAERMKFSAVLLFSALWFTISYIPIAHMVWGAGGYLLDAGALDFAGGTVVHINAAVAGLVGAYMLGSRIGYGKEAMPPHNLTFTMVGAALLWVGWFGFNAGSNLESNGGAGLAFINTLFATSAAVLAWSLAEAISNGKASMLGAASGAVAGLVAITPAAGFVTISQSIFIGFVAAIVSNIAIQLNKKSEIDDTLEVFPSHGVGGIVGMILTGVLAKDVGLIYGETTTFFHHMIALVGVALFTFFGSLLLLKIVDLILPLRVRPDQEERGLDLSQHGENIE